MKLTLISSSGMSRISNAGSGGASARRAHVDPDDAGALHDLVGLGLDLLLEARRRQARHVDAVAGDVELPAVVDAADAAFLVAAEEQRRAAVRAAVVHDADAAGAVAKRDQLLAEQHQAHGRAVALELGGHGGGDPVAAHQLAHRRAWADARELHAVFRRGHAILPKRFCARLSGAGRLAYGRSLVVRFQGAGHARCGGLTSASCGRAGR